ncbi:unnamed protein product [Lactuca saligna]|uniref:Uncharacterized protein n=1 Tax=Lactuca saligna TaxID=75948 RepID=A0AA36EL13_LACSI|nr:unnamed protein product [Lactuca saligna]
MKMTDDAKLNPINLTNDIVPRVMPYLYNSAKTYGKDVGNSLTELLLSGLADVEADQWAKHRKIMNHAFHVEKLKHMVPAFYISCSNMINKWEVLTKERSCAVDVQHLDPEEEERKRHFCFRDDDSVGCQPGSHVAILRPSRLTASIYPRAWNVSFTRQRGSLCFRVLWLYGWLKE